MKNIIKNPSTSAIRSLAVLLFVSLFSLVSFQSCKEAGITPFESAQYKTLSSGMQKLWADHMQWTYSTVDAFFNNPAGLDAQLNRLLQNQKDIGNAIVPFYGQAAGDQLTKLLTEHIVGAVPVLTAAKNGDNNGLTTALNDWYANAEEIGEFLNTANPEWAKHDMKPMMKMHIDQTTSYSVSLLQKNYDQAIKTYTEAHNHMLEMAEDLARGIAIQFPDQFK